MKTKRFLALVLILAFVLGVLGGCAPAASNSDDAANNSSNDANVQEDLIRIAMLPQFKGENYFDGCKAGAEAAAKDLGVELFYDGPNQSEATNAKQVEIVNGFIANGVDAIVIAPCDSEGIATTLQDAMAKGIEVVTYDCDARVDARNILVNQATAADIGLGLVKAVAGDLEAAGFGPDAPARLALISGSGLDESTNSWCVAIRDALLTDEYNWIKLNCNENGYNGGDIWTPGSDEAAAQTAAQEVMALAGDAKDGSEINAIIGMSTMSAPAIAAAWNAVSGEKPNVVMAGVATPMGLVDYILDEENPLNHGVLWDVYDLGYLAVETAVAMVRGELDAETAENFESVLGTKQIVVGESGGKEILMGQALIFDKETVGNYNY